MNKKRPKHLSLFKIKLPLPGIVSILHRVSGVFLFFSLPAILWLFQSSLRSIETWTWLANFMQSSIAKLIALGLVWTFLHHFCAGIRYLLLDFHIGIGLAQARLSSQIVMVVSLLLTAVTGVWIW